MHHTPGFFNGIWSDMAIETTYMRYGHSHSGIIGLIMKPEALKTWALSVHAMNTVMSDLNTIDDMETPSQSYHKEEFKGRIKTDAADRSALKEQLNLSIGPLDPEQHSDGSLVNIVTGKVVNDHKVNVDMAITIAAKEMKRFEDGWPASFHGPIQKKVLALAKADKSHNPGQIVADTETLYARAMVLQN